MNWISHGCILSRKSVQNWRYHLIPKLRVYPKIADMHIAGEVLSIWICPYRSVNKHLPTIRKIPDDLWDEIKLILPSEKSNNTIGRPVIPFREILDGIVCIKSRLSMEDVTKRVWFRFQMS